MGALLLTKNDFPLPELLICVCHYICGNPQIYQVTINADVCKVVASL